MQWEHRPSQHAERAGWGKAQASVQPQWQQNRAQNGYEWPRRRVRCVRVSDMAAEWLQCNEWQERMCRRNQQGPRRALHVGEACRIHRAAVRNEDHAQPVAALVLGAEITAWREEDAVRRHALGPKVCCRASGPLAILLLGARCLAPRCRHEVKHVVVVCCWRPPAELPRRRRGAGGGLPRRPRVAAWQWAAGACYSLRRGMRLSEPAASRPNLRAHHQHQKQNHSAVLRPLASPWTAARLCRCVGQR